MNTIQSPSTEQLKELIKNLLDERLREENAPSYSSSDVSSEREEVAEMLDNLDAFQ